MFVNVIVRYDLGLLMYKDSMTGCCFWHIPDCMLVEACKQKHTKQMDAEAAFRLSNDLAGSVRNLMLDSASFVMQQDS